MRMTALVFGFVVMSGPAWAQTAPQPSEVLLGLGGYCWQADLGEGATDTHCFSVAIGGKLVMDVHKVRSRSGADACEVGPAVVTAARRKFVKIGPAPEGGF